jgi:hypothetical protein
MMGLEEHLLKGRCPKCGAQYYGWTLLNPQNQTCERCGIVLEISEEGIQIQSGQPPPAAVSGNPAPTTMRISAASGEAAAGRAFSIDVRVDCNSAIAGAQMDLTFDPARFTVDGITEGNLFKQDGASTYFNPAVIDNVAGTVAGVAAAIISPGQTVSAPETFVTVNLTAKKTDTTVISVLQLANVIIGNIDGAAAPIVTQNAGITILPWEDWDVNCDNQVNILDIIIVGQNWGKTGPPHWIRADVNRDGKVDILDIILICQHRTG